MKLMMSFYALVLSIVCSLVANSAVAFFGGSSLNWDSGNPGVRNNPYLNVSQTLRLICTVASDESVDNVRFVYPNNSDIAGTFVKKVTTKIYELLLPNMQVEDGGIYLCVRDDGTAIGSQLVMVEYPLRPVLSETFSCEVFNWESMTCRWSLGVDYQHPGDINVTLVYVTNGLNRARHADCPQISSTSCRWPKGTFLTNLNKYLMCVIVKNNKTNEEIRSDVFTVESRNYVRPAKVYNITVRSRNNTCLHFSWYHNMKHREKIYMLTVTDVNNSHKTKVINTTYDTELVCDLEPYTIYNIGISCKPLRDGYWSEEYRIQAKTEQDVPRIGPPLTTGSYFQRRCDGDKPGSDSGNCRNVTIYWKPVPENKKNGEIHGYRVQYTGIGGHQNIFYVKGENSNSVILRLNQQRSYRVSLRANTSVGFSTAASLIFIPKAGEGISLPRNLLVQALVTSKEPRININISWSAPSTGGHLIQSYTIYWCLGSPSTYLCLGKIEWKRISSDQLRAQIKLPREDFEKVNYLIGISADNAISSSGLIWSDCIYHYGKLPQDPPHGLRFAKHNDDNSLSIEWNHYLCHESGFVISYMLYFCPVSEQKQCTGPTQNHSISSNLSEYRISNLKDGIRYAIWLAAVTEKGYGPETEKIFMKAINSQLKPGQIAGIAVGAIIVILMAIIGVVGSLRYINRKRKKLVKAPEFIYPPALPDIEFDTSSNRHNSGNSGYNHLPPSPTSQTAFISDDSGSQRSSMVGTDASQRSSRCLNDSFLQGKVSTDGKRHAPPPPRPPNGATVFTADKSNRLNMLKQQQAATVEQDKQQTWPLAAQGLLLLNPPDDNRGCVSLPVNAHLKGQMEDAYILPVSKPHEVICSDKSSSGDRHPDKHIDSYSAFTTTDTNPRREDLCHSQPNQTCDNFGYVKESDLKQSVQVEGEHDRVVRMEPSFSDYVMADSFGIHYPNSSVSSSSSLPYISRENSLTSILHAYPGACRCSGGRGPRVTKQRPRINTNGSLLRACMDPETSDTSLSSLECLKYGHSIGNQITDCVSDGRQTFKGHLPYNSNIYESRNLDYVPHSRLNGNCVDNAEDCAESGDYLPCLREGAVLTQTGNGPAFQHAANSSPNNQSIVTAIPIPVHDDGHDSGYIGLPTTKELAQTSATSVDDGICDSSGMMPYVKVQSYDIFRETESSDDGICDSSDSVPYVIAIGHISTHNDSENINDVKCDSRGSSPHHKPDTLGVLKIRQRPMSDYIKQLPPQYFSEIDNSDDLPITEL